MKTIFAVSSGSYSDYRVLCLCLTKKLAERVAAKINASGESYDTADVEEMNLMESADDVFVTTAYAVEIDATGRELHRRTFTRNSWRDSGLYSVMFQSGQKARGVSDRGYAQALKAARDTLAQWKAEQS